MRAQTGEPPISIHSGVPIAVCRIRHTHGPNRWWNDAAVEKTHLHTTTNSYKQRDILWLERSGVYLNSCGGINRAGGRSGVILDLRIKEEGCSMTRQFVLAFLFGLFLISCANKEMTPSVAKPRATV